MRVLKFLRPARTPEKVTHRRITSAAMRDALRQSAEYVVGVKPTGDLEILMVPAKPLPGEPGILRIEATDETVMVRLHPRRLDDPVAIEAVRRGEAVLIEAPVILLVESTTRPR